MTSFALVAFTQVVGSGSFQWALYIILGLALMGDGIELLMMAFVLPGAEREFCMNSPMKGWLGTRYIFLIDNLNSDGHVYPVLAGAIAFAGMIIGACLWGNMADRIGRRTTLISALVTNVAFGVAAAFMPDYSGFFICRLLSGVG